jgi:hypothetical protein
LKEALSFRRPLEAGVEVATLDFLLDGEPVDVIRTFGELKVERRTLGEAAKLDFRLLPGLSTADGRRCDTLAFLRARLVFRFTELTPNSSSPSMLARCPSPSRGPRGGGSYGQGLASFFIRKKTKRKA